MNGRKPTTTQNFTIKTDSVYKQYSELTNTRKRKFESAGGRLAWAGMGSAKGFSFELSRKLLLHVGKDDHDLLIF